MNAVGESFVAGCNQSKMVWADGLKGIHMQRGLLTS